MFQWFFPDSEDACGIAGAYLSHHKPYSMCEDCNKRPPVDTILPLFPNRFCRSIRQTQKGSPKDLRRGDRALCLSLHYLWDKPIAMRIHIDDLDPVDIGLVIEMEPDSDPVSALRKELAVG